VTSFFTFSECFDEFRATKLAASEHVEGVSVGFAISQILPFVAPSINVEHVLL
jgi:hypothetical protein